MPPARVQLSIVENDGVAGPQGWDQKLLDPGLECLPVDRSVEYARVLCTSGFKPTGRSGCIPSAPAAQDQFGEVPFRRSASQWYHLSSNPGLVHKRQPVRIKPVPKRLPVHQLAGHRISHLHKCKPHFLAAQAFAAQRTAIWWPDKLCDAFTHQLRCSHRRRPPNCPKLRCPMCDAVRLTSASRKH